MGLQAVAPRSRGCDERSRSDCTQTARGAVTLTAPAWPGVGSIKDAVCHAAFGRPLVTNVWRGLVAEAIIDKALGPEWEWCSQDYAAWDFRRDDGRCLEVKQAAARQSWSAPNKKPSRGTFDIRERLGRWDDTAWIAEQRRWADVYVFAYHPRVDDAADHRDPGQWRFYVVPTGALPKQKTITLTRVALLAGPVPFKELHRAVGAALA